MRGLNHCFNDTSNGITIRKKISVKKVAGETLNDRTQGNILNSVAWIWKVSISCGVHINSDRCLVASKLLRHGRCWSTYYCRLPLPSGGNNIVAKVNDSWL